MAVPVKTQQVTPQTVEDVLIRGDLASLTPEQRKEYYLNVCKSLNLNPLTQPFTYLTLNGKLILYPNRTCSDQLRRNNGISIEIISQDHANGVLSVHVRAEDKDRRRDEDLGVVSMVYPPRIRDRQGGWVPHPKAGKPLEEEDRANAIMKAITKAKRRLTLSISGLGWPDESEIEDIPAAAKGPSVNPETGEILEYKGPPPDRSNEIPGRIIEQPQSAGPATPQVPVSHASETPAPRLQSTEPIYETSPEWVARAKELEQQQIQSQIKEREQKLAARHSTEGEPHEIILTDPVDWIWFGQVMIEKAKNGTWDKWRDANTTNIARMENEAPKVFMRMNAAILKAAKDPWKV